MHKHHRRRVHQVLTHVLARLTPQQVPVAWLFNLVWRSTNVWMIIWAVLLLLQGVLPAAIVYLSKWFVNSLVAATTLGFSWQSVQLLLPSMSLIAIVWILSELCNVLSSWVSTIQSELLRDYINTLIHEKAISLDLAFYESPVSQNRLAQARSDASQSTLNLLNSIGNLAQNSITLLAMGAVLLNYSIWLPITLLLSTLPAFIILINSRKKGHRWWEQSTGEQRLIQYYDSMLTSGSVAAELRLFQLGDYFMLAYRSLRRKLRLEGFQLVRYQQFARLQASFLAMIAAAGSMLWMVTQLLKGLVTLGDLVLFYQAFNQGQSLMRSLVGNGSEIYASSLFLGNLFEFLNLEPHIVDPPVTHPIPSPLKIGIQFRNITFKYPHSDHTVLKAFNLTIPAGKIVAIVGDNGAGKSTLIKLLCRFYNPEVGQVEFDGVDIRKVALSQLRSRVTVLFQSPVRYYATAAENIAISEWASQPDLLTIERAAQKAGAHEMISGLPKGYDTQLGKGFFDDGVDLSGGEWQRVALSRAFLKQAQIIILDEPTSAMDSWAENDWLNRFRTLTQGRTAIVITHRFTLARRADIIHVMRRGEIVESGSHDDLLKQGGLYAESWVAQTKDHSSEQSAQTDTGEGVHPSWNSPTEQP
jgi:ATP-binding cassette, subfamily B, bacterial